MLERVAHYLQKGISPVSRVSAIIGMGLLVVLMLFITSDVVLRRFFGAPVAGSYEITQIILGVIIFTTLAYCGVQGAHIVVDVVVLKFPKRAQSSVGLIIHLGSVATMGLISWRLFLHAMKVKEVGEVSAIWGIWLYPFVFIAALGSVLLAMVFLVMFLQALSEVRRR